jgi:hypothetical protein
LDKGELIRRWYERWNESPSLGPREKLAAWITALTIFAFIVWFAVVVNRPLVAYSRQAESVEAWNAKASLMIDYALPGRTLKEISSGVGPPNHFVIDSDLIIAESKAASKDSAGVQQIAVYEPECKSREDYGMPVCPRERIQIALSGNDEVIWVHQEVDIEY